MNKTLGVMTIMALCALTQTAAAEAPATAGAIQLGGNLGYTLSLEDGDFNPWGLGLGVNGGITLDSGLYVGGLFDFNFGEERTVSGGGVIPDITFSAAGHFFGAVVGYDVGLSPELVIRPEAALGLHIGTADPGDGETDLFIAPGAELLYVGDGFYVGPQVRLNLVMADPDMIKALSVMLHAGATL